MLYARTLNATASRASYPMNIRITAIFPMASAGSANGTLWPFEKPRVASPQRSGRSMLWSFFSSGRVEEFATGLAQEIARRYPPAIANNPGRTISEERLATILRETFSGAHRFNQE